MTIALLIPTFNAGPAWVNTINAIENQAVFFDKKIIIDSGSTDTTVELAQKNGYEIININKKDFDHGGSRQTLLIYAGEIDILIYLTQDCILADKNSISNLITAFTNEQVAVAYGRQLPHTGAKILEAHSRYFNYPATSKVKSLDNKEILGIKTASCSNSFAAYRKKALMAVGGFPSNSIFGEDVIVGGKLLIKGWKIAYVAEAKAYHSHNYSPAEEFKRFFDIGVFHRTNNWLLKEFGKADSEGFKYVKTEIKVIVKNNIFLFPKMILSTLGKFLGYKLGLNYKHLPLAMCKMFTMHKNYWI